MKKIVFLFCLLFLFGCSSQLDQEPAEVVKDYFKSWNNKDYVKMYSLLSEGFKKIEPTANSFEDFKNYASSQDVEGVKVNNVNVLTNNGYEASVSYEIDYKINNKWTAFSGTYTLKNKENNWVLIHPYGKNADRT